MVKSELSDFQWSSSELLVVKQWTVTVVKQWTVSVVRSELSELSTFSGQEVNFQWSDCRHSMEFNGIQWNSMQFNGTQ